MCRTETHRAVYLEVDFRLTLLECDPRCEGCYKEYDNAECINCVDG